MSMPNVLASLGKRKHFQVDVTDEGALVAEENDQRDSLVMTNLGPNTAWAGNTPEEATPELGFPLLSGAGIVDDDSYSPWYFTTDTGETADIRGWEVTRP